MKGREEFLIKYGVALHPRGCSCGRDHQIDLYENIDSLQAKLKELEEELEKVKQECKSELQDYMKGIAGQCNEIHRKNVELESSNAVYRGAFIKILNEDSLRPIYWIAEKALATASVTNKK